LGEGLGEGMPWLEETAALRLDIGRLLPGLRTVVVLGCGYYHPTPSSPTCKVARYARSRDYHKTFRGWLKRLMGRLREAHPGMAMRAFVDSGPVMEKVWAAKAGLGFVGKNGCLICRGQGSWLLLATLLLSEEADAYGEEEKAGCGACRACIEACPTGAILEGKRVDARRCLSFHSIESRGPWPEVLRRQAGGWLFGCDVCQEVCPYNRKAPVGHEAFAPRAFAFWPVERFLRLGGEEKAALLGSPLMRSKFWGLRRNAAYILGASKAASARPLLLQRRGELLKGAEGLGAAEGEEAAGEEGLEGAEGVEEEALEWALQEVEE